MATTALMRRCLTTLRSTTTSSVTPLPLILQDNTTSITCWNVTCRCFSSRPQQGRERNFNSDRRQSFNERNGNRNDAPQRRENGFKREPRGTFGNAPPRRHEWNKIENTAQPPQTPPEKSPSVTIPSNEPQLSQETIEQVRDSEVESRLFREAIGIKEQKLAELGENTGTGGTGETGETRETGETVETGEIESTTPQTERLRKSRGVSTKSFERFITIHYLTTNALPSDVKRSIREQFGIEPKKVSTYVEPVKQGIVWLLEFENEQEAQEVLTAHKFVFEWLSPSLQPFLLPDMPQQYDGKAVLIHNLDNNVSVGDISGFLQDYGMITAENIGSEKIPVYLAKVTSEDAAAALVLMYHNYQYDKRQMAVYQLH